MSPTTKISVPEGWKDERVDRGRVPRENLETRADGGEEV